MDMQEGSTEKTPLLLSSGKEQSQEGNHKDVEEKSPLKCVTLCVLFTELCERLTYYSINGNMVLFLTSVLLFPSPVAVTINLVFTGKNVMLKNIIFIIYYAFWYKIDCYSICKLDPKISALAGLALFLGIFLWSFHNERYLLLIEIYLLYISK